jgi:RNA polymerase sigma factor (sigma-70 family)
LTGTALPGEERKKLLHRRFGKYVAPEDQNLWRQYFFNAFKEGRNESCELKGLKKDGSIFYVHLESQCISSDSEHPDLLMTLTDITEKKRSEQARFLFDTQILSLTKREREILALALSGRSNKEISTQLDISQRTVENHRSRIYAKTGVVSLLDLVHQASRNGLSLTEIVTSTYK